VCHTGLRKEGRILSTKYQVRSTHTHTHTHTHSFGRIREKPLEEALSRRSLENAVNSAANIKDWLGSQPDQHEQVFCMYVCIGSQQDQHQQV
jgi:hypothetical protein